MSNGFVSQPPVVRERPAVPAPSPATLNRPQVNAANLPLVRGSLGVQTRVARSIDELQALADTGDRSYSVFALPISDKPQTVGSAGWKLQLEKAVPKKNRFTLNMIQPVDPTAPKRPTLRPDLEVSEINQPVRHEYKNAGAYQPIQFHRSSPIRCDEIVILSVEENRVVGYLAESR